MEIVVGAETVPVEAADVATLDAALRRRDHDSHAGRRLRDALEGGEAATLGDSDLGELSLALHGLRDEGLSPALRRLGAAVATYFAGLEHGS